MPQARIKFEYEIYNEHELLLNSATTTLVFINKSTNRPCPAPEDFRRRFQNTLSNNFPGEFYELRRFPKELHSGTDEFLTVKS